MTFNIVFWRYVFFVGVLSFKFLMIDFNQAKLSDGFESLLLIVFVQLLIKFC